MHIFFDETVFLEQRFGGISRYYTELAYALACTGKVEVTIFGGYTANAYLQEFPKLPKLHIYSLPRKENWKIRKLIWQACKYIKRPLVYKLARQSQQLIYHPSNLFLDDFCYAQASATVATIHDLIPQILYPDNKHSKGIITNTTHLIEKAHQVIAISESTRRDILKYHSIAANKTNVVHLSSSFERTLPKLLEQNVFKQDSNTINSLIPTKPYIVYIGQRGDYKNAQLLFDTLPLLQKQFPELKVIFAGGCPFSDHERAQITAAGAENTVSQIPHIDDAHMIALLQEALCLVFPSLYEGFGIPVLDAMALGCPVITTTHSSLPEVGGKAALYIDGNNPQELLHHISLLYTNPTERSAIIASGLKHAKNFSWQKVANETLAVYEKALATQR